MLTFYPYAYHLWSRWLLGTLSISSITWASLVMKQFEKMQLALLLWLSLYVCVCVCVCMCTCTHVHICMCSQSCLTLYDSMGCSPPGSSVHGIFQAGILEWIAISYSGGSSWLWEGTCVPCISCTGEKILYHCTIWEALSFYKEVKSVPGALSSYLFISLARLSKYAHS